MGDASTAVRFGSWLYTPACDQRISLDGLRACACANTVWAGITAMRFTMGTVGRYVGTMTTDKLSIAYLSSEF